METSSSFVVYKAGINVTEIELIETVKTGFRKWISLREIYEFVIEERIKVPSKAPVLHAIAFVNTAGYIKLELNIVQLKRILNEDGSIRDLEIYFVNDSISEPTMLLGSIFQPNINNNVKFCRIYKDSIDCSRAFENIQFLSELAQDYQTANINVMRKRFGL